MSTYLVSDIDVKDFGAQFLKVGDLDGDGAPDLLLIQSDRCTREITCLTALTISGKVLWQTGVPSPDNGIIYSDLPVQVYDWDNDGNNEVLWVEQAVYLGANCWEYGAARNVTIPTTKKGELRGRKDLACEGAARYEGNAIMHVLDGRTGKEKSNFLLPAPADDCFLFADLTGRGRREDLVVKDRYWNMWGIAHDGTVLWHWAGNVGHFPAVADVDGDGKDEVFVGVALIDHDGRQLYDSPREHQDAVYVVQLADRTWRLLEVTDAIRCRGVDGRELWSHKLKHPQHVVAGRFRTDFEKQVMVIDRGMKCADGSLAPATLYCFDLDGRELWREVQPPNSWGAAIIDLDWHGGGAPQCLLAYNRGAPAAAIYDGNGRIIYTFPTEGYATRADVWGDSRDEIVFFGPHLLRIYANRRPLALPTHYNQTLYPGM
jgi:hypothetical protein